MSTLWWRLSRSLARLILRAYYRSFRVEGASRIPAEGPLLLVVNHPNSILDAAAVMRAVRRPLRFAAKGPLFRSWLLGPILRKLGAFPIERPQDEGADVRRNLAETFGKFAEVLGAGEVCVIFPEGMSHTDPQLKQVKSGPARIALAAEAAADQKLELKVVPIGLAFHPAQAFRGEVVVRVGEPFPVADLADAHRREAIRTVQRRIRDGLVPLMHHLEKVDLEPLVEGIAEVWDEHQRSIRRDERLRTREDIVHAAGMCLNHFLVTDPEAVEEVQRSYSTYLRLSGRAGVSPAALKFEERPVRAFLAFVGIGLHLAIGFPFFVFGLLTGFFPYRVTGRLAKRVAARDGGAVMLPLFRILVGAVVFGVFWGALAWLVYVWSSSRTVTIVFVAGMAVSGLYARWYAERGRSLRERFLALPPFFLKKRAVTRVAQVRAELLSIVSDLVQRYEVEAQSPLLPPAELRFRRRVPWIKLSAIVAAGWLAWFLVGLGGGDLAELSETPSPWLQQSGDVADRSLERDAEILVGYLDTLDRLEARMHGLRDDFGDEQRTYYEPEDVAAIQQCMLTYLTCREGLFRIAWYYRESGPSATPEQVDRAFLLSYAAAVELCARGMQFVDTFDGDDLAIAKLNEGEPSWDLPPRTYDTIRSNLAHVRVLDALADGTAKFEQLEAGRRLPVTPPWARISRTASAGAAVVGDLARRLLEYKWDHALARARTESDQGRYVASSIVSTWIGDARINKQHEHGLITTEQVDWIRPQLQPGDILLERRNWYLSNAFLPGFWPHSAIYVGGVEGLEFLEIDDDPRVEPHVAALRGLDSHGDPLNVIEAISDGVVFTSLDYSVGGADAVCVFRPNLTRKEIGEAVARAIRHRGKPYDFDFDFFSTDRLVCTEVVYQAYHGPLDFPLVDIMGRKTLPALEFVHKWNREKGTPDAQLELVLFLDADEAAGVARVGDAETLVATLDRPGMTLLQDTGGGRPMILSPVVIALGTLLALGLVLLRRR